MLISLIVALTPDYVIGRNNDLPWCIPADLRHFRRTTMGKPMIMGRRNHESIGRALPGRDNIILTRSRHYSSEGCLVAHDMDEALALAGDAPEVMVIGGADIYRLFFPVAGRLYLTWVHAEIEGDVRFPAFDPEHWTIVEEHVHPADDSSPYPLTFQIRDRRTAA